MGHLHLASRPRRKETAQLREYNQERGHANAHGMGHLHLALLPTKRIKRGTTMCYDQQCGHANALRMGHLHIASLLTKQNQTRHNCESIIKSVAAQMPLEWGALILHHCLQKAPNQAQLRESRAWSCKSNVLAMGHLHLASLPKQRIRPVTTTRV